MNHEHHWQFWKLDTDHSTFADDPNTEWFWFVCECGKYKEELPQQLPQYERGNREDS